MDAAAPTGPAFLNGGGACGALIAARDWGATPLGPLGDWPQSLRTATAILLRSRVAMVMLWGADGVMLYNDAYAVFAGGRHPVLLGSKVREGWAEVADFNDHVMRVGLAGGTLAYRGQELTLHRNGTAERVWMDLDYSPVLGEAGEPAGVLAIVTETTERVEAERRSRESEAELRMVSDAMPVLLSYIDRDERYRFVNRTYQDWLLTPPEELVGRTVREVIGDASYAAVKDRMDQALAGELVEFSSRLGYADGRTRDVEISFVPRRAGDGMVEGFHALVVDVSRRKAAEDALRSATEEANAQAAERAAMLGQLAEGVIMTDAQGRVTFVNAAAERLHGTSTVGVVPTEDARNYVLLAEDGGPHPPRELPLARAVIHGETVTDARWRIRRADGSEVLAIGSAQPVHDADGVQIGAVLTLRDDTARGEAEAALRLSEERLRAVVEAAPVGLVFADADGRITGGNTQVERITGHPVLPSPDIDSYRDWIGYHPDGRRVEGPEYPLARALAGEERPSLEVLYQRGDGRLAWIRFIAAAKHDADGRIVGAVVASLDIDAERRAEDELRRLNAELEARVAQELAERRVLAEIVERTDAEIQVLSGDLRFLAINAAAVAAYRRVYGAEPRVGDRLLDLLPDADERERAEAVWRRTLAGEEFAIESEWGDPGVERRWYDMRFRSLRRDDGEVWAAYLIAYDVTERMRQRERLAQAEDALRQAQKMEAVGQLTGGIAHDFNNLLGAVVGSLDLIRRRPDDLDRVKRYAEAGLQAAERGAKLTGQLLAFSRAQRIELKPLSVAELVGGMRDLLARTLGPMIDLRFDLEAGDAAVLSDATQVEMAVLNLAINARDAMTGAGTDAGALTVATALRRVEDDPELASGDYVELAVADTGAGMDAETLARAFDPFFTTKGVGKGTGLGLSQVYGVARQTGGAVRIDSRVGEGTTVRILLPRTDAPVRVDTDEAAMAGEAQGTVATVLVVDDDPDVRRVLVDALDALGYLVVEAEDGPIGLEMIDAQCPDLLLVDFAMPGMNGAEVARAARVRCPELPVLFVSGYSDTAAIEDAAGPDVPVLRKPFRVGDLQAMVAGALARPAG